MKAQLVEVSLQPPLPGSSFSVYNIQQFHYLSAGNGLFAIYEMNSTGKNSMYYIHTDYLGSYQTITNEQGNVVEELSFGSCLPVRNEMKAGLPVRNEMKAGGRRRNPTDWTYNNVPTTHLFDRGFTGHEHLNNFDLINMNGRMYDPWLGRFLSPDPFVQAPTYSQNFNRYSYALNNPLKYTDPSGEFLLTWSLNNSGFSIGLNFTPVYPVGFGLNFGWADGFSAGIYGEVGPRFGGTGLGSGFTISQSLDYNFKHNNWSTTTSEGGYASFGIFNAGANMSVTYDISNSKWGDPNWGVSAGIGIMSDEEAGFGLYLTYGSGGLNFGVGGYYDSRNKPKVYTSPISDNFGNERGECAYRCLEKSSESYGMNKYDYDYWLDQYKKYDNKTPSKGFGVHPNDMEGLINSTGVFSSETINGLDDIVNAFKSNKRVIMGVRTTEDIDHAVMVRKVKIWPSGSYRVYFSETSQVRMVPYSTYDLKHIMGVKTAGFWTFYPR